MFYIFLQIGSSVLHSSLNKLLLLVLNIRNTKLTHWNVNLKSFKTTIILKLFYTPGFSTFSLACFIVFKSKLEPMLSHVFWSHISISDLTDFILAVIGVRIGTMGAVLASCKVRQSSLMSMSVHSASRQRMP